MTNPAHPELRQAAVQATRWHELKTDPEVFDAVASGAKTHEIRRNDRGFQVGDGLLLRRTRYTGAQMHMRPEACPLEYTGETERRVVSHVLSGYGLGDGWVILSFASPGQEQAGQMWRCFHCDETFTTEDAAREHFGSSERQQPACTIDIAEYRRMEEAHRRQLEEDTDWHRAFYKLGSDHAQAMRQHGDDEYARGLRDGVNLPSDSPERIALLSASPVQEGAAPKGSRPSKEWYAAMIAQTLDDDIVIGSGAPMDAAGNPKLPRHKFWGAGEPDCPADLKAPNGELHSMRCKVCGDGWRNSVDVCFAALRAAPKGEAADEQKRQAYQAMCRAHSYCPSDLPHLRKMQWQGEYMLNALLAMGATPIAPPAAQPATSSEAAPAPAPNACRVELVTAMHGLISQIENTLYAFGEDAEARRQAEGAVRHARKVADRWNWNGPWEKTPAAQPAAPTMEAPVGVPITVAALAKAADRKMSPIMRALNAVGADVTINQPLDLALIGAALCNAGCRLAAPAGESNERAASGQDEGNVNG